MQPQPGTTTAPEALDRYGTAAVVLHWLTALLVVANLLLGLSMVPLPLSPRKFQWYAWHKWIGVTVLLVTAIRLGWRAFHPAPRPLPAPAWQQRAAAATHALLYVLLLAVPLSGWIYSSATGVQVVYLGLFPLPDLVAKDRELAALLRVNHLALDAVLFILVALHAAAVVKHRFVDRDAVLERMLPGRRTRRSSP